MAANALVQTRIDAAIKEKAEAVLLEQGMTVSGAVRILLTRIANEGTLPFAPPMAATQAEYDAWFRAKVQEALDNPGVGMSNEEANAYFAAKIAKLREAQAK